MSPEDKTIDKSKQITTSVNLKIGGKGQEQYDTDEFYRVANLIKNKITIVEDYDLNLFPELHADGILTWKQLLNKFASKNKFRQYFDLKDLTNEDLKLVNFTFSLDTKETFTEDNIALNSKDKYVAVNVKISPALETVDKSLEVLTNLNVKIAGKDQEQFDKDEFLRVANLIKDQLEKIKNYDLKEFEELHANGVMSWKQLLNKFADKYEIRKYFDLKDLTNEDLKLVNFTFSLDSKETFTEDSIALNSKDKYVAVNVKISPALETVDKNLKVSTNINVKIAGKDQEEFDKDEFLRVANLIKDQLEKIKNYDLTMFEELKANGVIIWKQLLNKFADKDKFKQYFNLKDLTVKDLSLVNFTFSFDETESFNEHNVAILKSKDNYIALNVKILPEIKTIDKTLEVSTTVNVKINGFTQEEFDEKEFIRVSNLVKEKLEKVLNYDLTMFEELQADGIMTWKELLNKFNNSYKFKKYFDLEQFTEKQLSLINFSFIIDEKEKLNEHDIALILKEKTISIKIIISPENKNIDKKYELTSIVNVKFAGINQEEYDKQEFLRVANLIKTQLEKVLNYDLTIFEELQADGVMTWKQLLNKFADKPKFKEYFNLKDLTEKDLSLVNFTFTISEDKSLNENSIVWNSNGKYIALNLKISPEIKAVDKNFAVSSKVNVKIAGLDQKEYDEKEFIRVATLIKEQLEKVLNYDLTMFEELQADGIMTWKQLLNKFADKTKLYFNLKDLTEKDLSLVNFYFTFSEKETLSESNIALNSMNKYIALKVNIVPEIKTLDKDLELSTNINVKIGGLTQEQFDEKEFIRVSKLIKEKLEKLLNYDLTSFEELKADGVITWKELLNKFNNYYKFKKYFNLEQFTDKQLNLIDFTFIINEKEKLNKNDIALILNEKTISIKIIMSPENKKIDKRYELTSTVNVKFAGLDQKEYAEKEFIRVSKLIEKQLKDVSYYDLTSDELKANGIMNWKQLLDKLANKDNFRKYFNIKDLTEKELELVEFTFTINGDESLNENSIVWNSKGKYIVIDLKISPKDKRIDKKYEVNTKINVQTHGLTEEEQEEKEFIRVATLIKNKLEKNYDLSIFDELKANGVMTWNQLFNKLSSKDKFRKYFNLTDLTVKDLSWINFSFTVDETEELKNEFIVLSSNGKHIEITLKMTPQSGNIDKKNEISTKINVKIDGTNKEQNLKVISEKAWSKIKYIIDKYTKITEKYFYNDILYFKNMINDELKRIKFEIPELNDPKLNILYNGMWKISISNINNEYSESAKLFHEQNLGWNINLSFTDITTDEEAYTKDLNFNTEIDWASYQQEIFDDFVKNIEKTENEFVSLLNNSNYELEENSWYKEFLRETKKIYDQLPPSFEFEEVLGQKIHTRDQLIWYTLFLIAVPGEQFQELGWNNFKDSNPYLVKVIEKYFNSSFIKNLSEKDSTLLKEIFPKMSVVMEGGKFIFTLGTHVYQKEMKAESSDTSGLLLNLLGSGDKVFDKNGNLNVPIEEQHIISRDFLFLIITFRFWAKSDK